MSSNLTPLQVCERLIGKPEQISVICGMQEKAAYAWRHGSNTRAAGHLPSTQIQQRLLAHSAAHRLGLTADHLIWGAPEAEIAEILAARATALQDPPFISRRSNAQDAAA